MYAISWVFACQDLRQLLWAYLLKSSTKCDHAQRFSTQTNVLIGWIQRFLLATTVQNCYNVQNVLNYNCTRGNCRMQYINYQLDALTIIYS